MFLSVPHLDVVLLLICSCVYIGMNAAKLYTCLYLFGYCFVVFSTVVLPDFILLIAEMSSDFVSVIKEGSVKIKGKRLGVTVLL